MHYNHNMKLVLRRIGSSLGIIVPKTSLQMWGSGEGDYLELNERGIRPIDKSANSHEVLDELKRKLAAEVASRFTPNLIRAHGLGNLHRWQRNGVWGPVYEEWQTLLEDTNDGELFAAMLGRDEHSNRLRQSPPYVGLLPREVVRRLNEEATG
jgi:antitoxin component of MazEF toxin-antitoxin module